MLMQAYHLQFPSGHCYTEELKGEFQIHIQFEGDENMRSIDQMPES